MVVGVWCLCLRCVKFRLPREVILRMWSLNLMPGVLGLGEIILLLVFGLKIYVSLRFALSSDNEVEFAQCSGMFTM